MAKLLLVIVMLSAAPLCAADAKQPGKAEVKSEAGQKAAERGHRARTMEDVKADLGGSDGEKRRAALHELRASTSPLRIDILKDQMENQDPAIRGGAVRALGETGDKSVLPALFEALGSSDTKVRLGAIEALGLLKDPSAAIPLAGLLKDGNRNIRWAAVRSLGDIGDKGAVAPLLDAVETDSSTYVRQAAIAALGKIGDKAAAAPLSKFLDDSDAGVREWASSVLGTLGYEK